VPTTIAEITLKSIPYEALYLQEQDLNKVKTKGEK